MQNKETNYPMILVFYLDGEMMKIKEIIEPFAEYVNNILAQKNSNAIAFFLPTKGEERVECINPVVVDGSEMIKINKMVEDIKQNFHIGQSSTIADEEIELDDKKCDCNDNTDKDCDC